MSFFVYILEIIGTIAFAFSGAMTAIKKELDLFGVMILAVITAVGGGVIRDLLLGDVPPRMFLSPIYVIVAALFSVLLFIWVYWHEGKLNSRFLIWTEKVMLYADTVGLAVFTVIGVRTAFDSGQTNLFLAIFVGTITGVGGGVLRDMMVNVKPYIFVKHIYAISSVLGATVCALLWRNHQAKLGMIIGALIVVVMRVLAIHFEWNLPKANKSE